MSEVPNVQDADADLLAQLNGQAPKNDPDALPGFVGGETLDKGPSQEEQLEVHDAPAPSPIAAADAVHATVAGGKGYEVTVAGTYFAQDPTNPKGKTKKPYKISFNVPRLEGCRSLIKNHLLGPALRKLHPDFITDRTIEIVGQRPLGPDTAKSRNLGYMNREELEGHVKSHRVPVVLNTFAKNDRGTTQLRESIIDYVQNPDPVRRDKQGNNLVRPGDKGTFLARERERQQKRIEAMELAALNPGVEIA